MREHKNRSNLFQISHKPQRKFSFSQRGQANCDDTTFKYTGILTSNFEISALKSYTCIRVENIIVQTVLKKK